MRACAVRTHNAAVNQFVSNQNENKWHCISSQLFALQIESDSVRIGYFVSHLTPCVSAKVMDTCAHEADFK